MELAGDMKYDQRKYEEKTSEHMDEKERWIIFSFKILRERENGRRKGGT